MTELGLVVFGMEAANVRRAGDWFALDDVDRDLWLWHGRNVFQGRYNAATEPKPRGATVKRPPGLKPATSADLVAFFDRQRAQREAEEGV